MEIKEAHNWHVEVEGDHMIMVSFEIANNNVELSHALAMEQGLAYDLAVKILKACTDVREAERIVEWLDREQ